ncbi:MAG: hypothetical protein HY055_16195 [Magnetospirillum sp.]|nr:hypothetical protein [Magnetospirillum sp.]
MTDESPPVSRPLRKWQKSLLWGWVLTPVIVFVGLARAFTFDWMPSPASDYVETVVRAHLARVLADPGQFRDRPVLAMEKSYAGCRRWLPQELWQDCIALGLSEDLIALGGVEHLRAALANPCPSIDWLEGLRGVHYSILDEKYRALSIDGRDSRIDMVADMHGYFHCDQRRRRSERVTVYALSKTPPFRTKLTELTFQH